MVDNRHDIRAYDDSRSVVLLRRHGGSEERDLYDAPEFHSHGYHFCSVGGIRFLTLLWR